MRVQDVMSVYACTASNRGPTNPNIKLIFIKYIILILRSELKTGHETTTYYVSMYVMHIYIYIQSIPTIRICI